MASVRAGFRGRHVLLTGVTGFVGQLALSKLLAVSPDVARVYVVIRGQKSKTAEKRFQELLSSPAFELARKAADELKVDFNAWIKEKVQPVNGDVATKDLGLSQDDLTSMRQHVSAIIHSAADVSFTNTFEVAMKANLGSTVHVLAFAKSCARVDGLCYVSTSYVSSNKRNARYHYPVHVSMPVDVTQLAEAVVAGEDLSSFEKSMADYGWPNSYIMSKVAGEDYLWRNHGSIPVATVRPSMVAGALRDLSERGWNLGTGGPTLGTFAMGLGFLTIVPVAPGGGGLDLVPVDYVCNVILVTLGLLLCPEAAEGIRPTLASLDHHPTAQEPTVHTTPFGIYHAAMGEQRLMQREFYPTAVKYFQRNPVPGRIRSPRLALFPHAERFDRELAVRYELPIQALSLLEKVTPTSISNKSKQLRQGLEKLVKLIGLSRWVLVEEFIFTGETTGPLFELLSLEERELLWNDMSDLDRTQFIHDYCAGVVKMMEGSIKSKL